MKRMGKEEKMQQLNISIPVKKTEILFHERMKELRKKYELNQRGMAELLVGPNGKSLPYMTYVGYEQPPSSDNHRLPPYEILMQVSEIFKVSTDWLLGLTEYPFREGHSVDFSSLLYFSKNLTAAEQQILKVLVEKMDK